MGEELTIMIHCNTLIRLFKIRRFSLILVASILPIGELATAGPLKLSKKELDAKILGAEKRFSDLQSKPKKAIPPVIMRSARGLIIMRKVKAGIAIGAEAGSGVALFRQDGGTWTAPAFVSLAEASFGAQLGAQDQTMVIVLMTRESFKYLEKGREGNVGVELKATGGPVDFSKTKDTNKLAPILIYSDAEGGFAGLSVKAGGIAGAKRKNMTYYGMTLPDILFNGKAPVSDAGMVLIESIIKQARSEIIQLNKEDKKDSL